MSDAADPVPDDHHILFVGQDRDGHWLVQEDHGLLEGRFISFDAAMSFARAERHGFRDAEVALAPDRLTSAIPFARLAAPMPATGAAA